MTATKKYDDVHEDSVAQIDVITIANEMKATYTFCFQIMYHQLSDFYSTLLSVNSSSQP